MIDGEPVLALIPARGGSKGLPRKNVLDIGGRPMIAWSVEAAAASRHVDRIVVSTDDPEIMSAAVAAGAEAPFTRPAALSNDTASTMAVVEHALDALGFDTGWLVLLQPTSPLRRTEDIDGAVERCLEAGGELCVSACDLGKPLAWLFHQAKDGTLAPVTGAATRVSRRQDVGPVLSLNGAVYVGKVPRVRREGGFLAPDTLAYVMPRERSVDIDDAVDLELARILAKG